MENLYKPIDQTIRDWASRNQLVLQTHYASNKAPEFRCIYTSSKQGECCQIWIEPPSGERVDVHAEDVESRRDEPMRYDWQTSIQDLNETLETALRQVQEWFNRDNAGSHA